VNALRAALLGAALALAACASDDAETPCAPACASGETCSFGVCQVRCNPACGASQQCILVGGATRCVGVDAGTVRDVTADQPPGVDAPADGADEVPSFDAASDLAAEATTPDVALDAPAELPATDAPAEAAADVPVDIVRDVASEMPAMDASIDAPADVGLDAPAEMPAIDVPRDVVTEPPPADAAAEMPAGDVYMPPACGEVTQPCCGGNGGDVACRAGLVCNAFENGRCVRVTDPAPLECSSSSSCTGGRVCQGPGFCGTRACMRCNAVGMLAYDVVCDARMMGANCATGSCLTGRCSWACAPGTAGDAECSRRAPNTRCQEVYYGINIVAMRPTAWVTLGSCVPVCRRNSECTMGRVCGAIPSLLDDRVEYNCIPEGRMPAGATCTSGEMCQSLMCLSIPGVGRRCTTPCLSNMDCPAAAPRCGDLQLLRPGSGAEQASRGCLPP